MNALDNPHPRVAEHAALLARGVMSGAVVEKLLDLASNHVDVRVRWRAAGAIGPDMPGRGPVLAAVLRRDGANPWVRYAAIQSLGDEAAEALASMLVDGGANRAMLEELARVIEPGKWDAVLPVATTCDPLEAAAVARGLAARGDGPALARLVPWVVGECRRIALAPARSATDRAEAARTLALGAPMEVLPVLAELLHPRQPPAVQAAAVTALDRMNNPGVAEVLLAALPASPPAVRPRIVDALLARPDRSAAMLDAVEAGRLPASELAAEYRSRLVAHPDEKLRGRTAKLLALSTDRAALVERYQREMAGLKGDTLRGQQVFVATCASCHRVGGVGFELGPNLIVFAPRGPEAILLNVLDPNREVNPQFVGYMVTTTDGRTLAGVVTSETDAALTLAAGAGGEHTVPREQIASITSTGQSLMPIGLEAAITPQAMADLVAYLTSAQR